MSRLPPNFWFCDGCGLDLRPGDGLDEYYMIHNRLWQQVRRRFDRMLCIGCVEERLGRHLTPADFTDCPLNKSLTSSRRLSNRSGRPYDPCPDVEWYTSWHGIRTVDQAVRPPAD